MLDEKKVFYFWFLLEVFYIGAMFKGYLYEDINILVYNGMLLLNATLVYAVYKIRQSFKKSIIHYKGG